jgi:hypothetical protein
VSLPWPGWTQVSSGSTANSRCSTSSIRLAKRCGFFRVLPTPPGNPEGH